jgi:hypothetical protein
LRRYLRRREPRPTAARRLQQLSEPAQRSLPEREPSVPVASA